MPDPNKPHVLFREEPSGLLVAQGTAFGGFYYPDSPGQTQLVLRQALLNFRMGVVPDFKDVWPSEHPKLEDMIRAMSRRSWFSWLGRISVALASPVVDRRKLEADLVSVLSADELKRLNDRFQGQKNRMLIHPFAVHVAIELAAVFAPDGPAQAQLSRDDVRAILKVLLLVAQEINGTLAGKIMTAPAGVAAALSERSVGSSAFETVLRSFGVWVLEHPMPV